MNLTGGIIMLTENNTLNWLRFMRDVLDNKEDTKLINDFIYKHWGHSAKYTSRIIYNKYCK